MFNFHPSPFSPSVSQLSKEVAGMNMNFPLQVITHHSWPFTKETLHFITWQTRLHYMHKYLLSIFMLLLLPLLAQDSMRGMNPSTLQSMFQANHMGKAGLYDSQGGKMKKKQPMMLHSDPSILGKWRPFLNSTNEGKVNTIYLKHVVWRNTFSC